MKYLPALVCLATSLTVSAIAQPVQPAREIVKKAIPKDQRPAQPPSTPPQSPSKPSAPASAASKPVAPPIKEKTAAEKAEIEKKTIEFQKKRAKEGSASSQYDLGMRYLTGNGVEKDLKEGRKWIEASAKQNNPSAVKKLKELDKKP